MSGAPPNKLQKFDPFPCENEPCISLTDMSSSEGVFKATESIPMTSEPTLSSEPVPMTSQSDVQTPVSTPTGEPATASTDLQQGETSVIGPAVSPVVVPSPLLQTQPLKNPETNITPAQSNVVFTCPLERIGDYFIPDRVAPEQLEDPPEEVEDHSHAVAQGHREDTPQDGTTSLQNGSEIGPAVVEGSGLVRDEDSAASDGPSLSSALPSVTAGDLETTEPRVDDGADPTPVGQSEGATSSTVDESPAPVEEERQMIQRDFYELVPSPVPDPSIAERLLEYEYELCEALNWVSFTDPVTHVYNPLEYARETHECFVRKYCCSEKKVLFLGMNPGPFGMAQNGVPFGVKDAVVNWLRITGKIGRPAKEHPKRPILGFDCPRTEISGTRFWDLFKLVCGDPCVFFRHCYVHNYCPMAFMSKTGRNVTPNNLHITNREPLLHACDVALADVVRLLKIETIIAIGKFAHDRTKLALKTSGVTDIRVECILHPSPINPMANHGWNGSTIIKLKQLGVWKYLLPSE